MATPIPDAVIQLNRTYGSSLTYFEVYKRVLSGEIAASRDPGGRRWVIQDDLLRVADVLGLAQPPELVQPRRRRRPAA